MIKVYLFIFLLVLPMAAFAKKIQLSSYFIPGLVESSSEGSFVDILTQIEQVTPLSFELTLMPTKRVQASFAHGKITGYFPELEEFRDPQSCRSSAFMHKQIVAFTRRGDPSVLALPQLRNKRVGAVFGYSYGLAIKNDARITLTRVDNDITNLKKLLAGRLDVVLGDANSTLNAVKELAIEDKVNFDVQNPIAVLDVFFVFKPDEEGQKNCAQVSAGIEQLKQNGKLSQWLYTH